VRTASPDFWHGKQVLLTGHTGFKGAWMALWLAKMGARVIGISLAPNSTPNLFALANIAKITNSHFVDVRDVDAVSNIIKEAQPDIVLHLAAQALVRRSYKDPLGTFDTNVMGTANVLHASRRVNSIKAIVVVTTDKVYKNLETGRTYKEDDQLGGFDPYSASKAASELVIASYRDSYLFERGIAIASARAGNVIGGGDWSEDRLIPDAVRAWDSDLPLQIRRPNAIRPWQHVLEPLNGYLVLAEKLYADKSFSGAYNFGPKADEAATVRTVIRLANKLHGRGKILWTDEVEGPHEASLLSLEISKARELLDIVPRWNLTEAIKRTMEWYQGQRNGVNARLLCDADIAGFFSAQEAL
jgi:CDP-glucose 4,6-dehydratase